MKSLNSFCYISNVIKIKFHNNQLLFKNIKIDKWSLEIPSTPFFILFLYFKTKTLARNMQHFLIKFCGLIIVIVFRFLLFSNKHLKCNTMNKGCNLRFSPTHKMIIQFFSSYACEKFSSPKSFHVT